MRGDKGYPMISDLRLGASQLQTGALTKLSLFGQNIMWEIKEVPWSLSFWISILLVSGSIIMDEIDSHGLRH
jgi:hypothetical protein